MIIYVIHDKKANFWQFMGLHHTHVHAIRVFRAEVRRKDPANPLNTNPEDFDLYALAKYDTHSGDIELFKPSRELIATATGMAE